MDLCWYVFGAFLSYTYGIVCNLLLLNTFVILLWFIFMIICLLVDILKFGLCISVFGCIFRWRFWCFVLLILQCISIFFSVLLLVEQFCMFVFCLFVFWCLYFSIICFYLIFGFVYCVLLYMFLIFICVFGILQFCYICVYHLFVVFGFCSFVVF